MLRLTLVAGLLAISACVPVGPPVGGPIFTPEPGLPVHPDPFCAYTEPFAPGEPLGEVCA